MKYNLKQADEKQPIIGHGWKVKKTYKMDDGANSFCSKCGYRFTIIEEVDLQLFISCGGDGSDYKCPKCGEGK